MEKNEGLPRIFINYNELITSPGEPCRKLSEFLDAQYGIEGLPQDRLTRMFESVDFKLNHHHSDITLFDRQDVTQDQKDLYRFLLHLVGDPSIPFDPSKFPIYAGWREYLINLDQALRIYIRARPIFESWLVKGFVLLSWPIRQTVQIFKDLWRAYVHRSSK